VNTLPQPSGSHQSTGYELAISRRVAWLVAICLMGYPLLGTLVSLTSFSSSVASVPVRAAMIFLSLTILIPIWRNLPWRTFNGYVHHTPVRTALILFWLLYLCRMIWDWQIVQMPEAGPSLLFFGVVGLLPALALLDVGPSRWNDKALARTVFFLGAPTCVLAVAITLLGFAGERSLMEQTSRLSFDTVNPITYGHVAVTTLLAGLFGWVDSPRRQPTLPIVIGVVAALATIDLAGSKGPLVALLVCLITLGVFKPRLRWLLVVMLAVAAWLYFIADNSNLGYRISNLEADQSTVVRKELLLNAIDQFWAHPFLGSAFLDVETHTYPHNPLIEAAMAVGLVGGCLYGLVLVNTALRLLGLLLRKDHAFLATVTLQYMIGEHISGSLHASGALWICIAMIISVTSCEAQRECGRDITSNVEQVSAKRAKL